MRVLAGVLILAAAAAAKDPDELLLERKGILPTHESLRSYLRTLYPQPGSQERMARYVRHLGSPETAVRDYATRMLNREGASAAAVLQRSLDHDEPEVRWRARLLLEQAKARLDPSPMYSAYVTIERKRIPGLALEILRSLAITNEGHIRAAGRRALEASATVDDADILREAIAGEDPGIRAASLRALGRVLGAEARDDMVALLEDEDPGVRYAAAVSLARVKDEAGIEALVELLACDDAQTRYRSVTMLRKLSGSRFDYSPYAAADKRAEGVGSWRRWLRLENRAVDWDAAGSDLAGVRQRIVVAVGKRPKSEIFEIDLQGKVYRRHEVPDYTRGVGVAANGNVLVSLYTRRVVAEYDADGREVWRSNRLRDYPSGVQRLANGNTLVTHPRRGKVIEITPRSRVVWEATAGNGCYYAQRLDSGLTRAALYNSHQIVELDRRGEVRHRIQAGGQPFMVRARPGGNLVVCIPSRGMVAEIDRTGSPKKQWAGFFWPSSAIPLPGGEIVVCDRRGVYRVMADGSKKTLLRAAGVSWMAYY